MSEDALWKKVRDDLGPWGKLVRIENLIGKGVGDLAYVLRAGVRGPVGSGWLELKHEDAWPVRPQTAFTISTLTRDQVDFHRDWAAAGGRAWTLLQVGRGYWLLDPPTLAAVFRRDLVPQQVRRAATVGDPRRLPVGDVLRALTR